MLRLAFDFIITWRETRTRPNAYDNSVSISFPTVYQKSIGTKTQLFKIWFF